VLTDPLSPLFGPFFRAKRTGPARLGPLRSGLGQKIKPAGSAGPARFLAGLHRTRAGPGRAARLAISSHAHAVTVLDMLFAAQCQWSADKGMHRDNRSCSNVPALLNKPARGRSSVFLRREILVQRRPKFIPSVWLEVRMRTPARPPPKQVLFDWLSVTYRLHGRKTRGVARLHGYLVKGN
jgi:hypothetical protein